ncbi:MAG TPA: hypothetical protein VNO19_05105 [Gemmatimonadales bacterium]|nr:hypothetical protein [Gemmatimonadales bacterium]
MAATRKSAKRRAAKKSASTKRPSSRKKPARKSTPKRHAKKTTASKAAGLKRQAKKGLKVARGGIGTVLHAGEKTWKTLKNTTANVVEGVKETFAGDPPRRSRSR